VLARLTTTDDSAAELAALFALPHALGFVHAPTEEQVRSAIAKDGIESWVVERDGRIVAHMILGCPEPWLWEVRTLVVRDQRCGIGAFAIRRAIERAFEEGGAHRIFLEVVERNHGARALYESLGFKAEGCYRDGYRDDDGSYQNLIPYGILESEYRPT